MPILDFDFEPKQAALLVIDMQNGFAAPEGTLGKAGFDIGMTRAIIPKIQQLVEAARQAGVPVFWSRQIHYPDDRTRCFYSTTLEAKLRIHGVRLLIVTGTTSSFCVDSTIREAYARDFDVVVPGDAISDTEMEATRAVLRSTERFHGYVTTTDDVVTKLHALA